MMASRKANGEIKNSSGDRLDFVVEGNPKAHVTIVFVHGFGTDKNEGTLFVDLSKPLSDNYRILRFDFSGYGKSGGRQEDVNLLKQADDVKAVLEYVRTNYGGEIYILAFSAGCFAVAELNPVGVEKTLFVSPVGANPKSWEKSLKKRILSKQGGVVDEDGISIYPRTSGEVQRIGSSYWKALKEFNPIAAVTRYAKKTRLLVIRPIEDDVIVGNVTRPYQEIPGLLYLELHGNHGFTNQSDRHALIEKIESLL